VSEHTWILDPASGALVVAGLTSAEALALAGDLLPSPHAIGCGRPLTSVPLPITRVTRVEHASDASLLRVARMFHGSVVDGPGRRSVCQFQWCRIRCPGCWVPETHDPDGGVALTVAQVLTALLDPCGAPRDGITVSGGEPFDQPEGLLALLDGVRAAGLPVMVFTGYTLEQLTLRPEPAVRAALHRVDLLLDGPYVAALADGAGLWRGSRNQRLIPRPATRLTSGPSTGPTRGAGGASAWMS
jgi:anaerobic ribonucleoside-triphosphate reductase activating protein